MTDAELSVHERILQILALIPHGYATSYGQVAELAGLPGRARLVARILAQLPDGSQIPWQRVLRSDRQPAFAPASSAWQRQADRLKAEGIDLHAGRVPLSQWWPQCLLTSASTASISRKRPNKPATSRKLSR